MNKILIAIDGPAGAGKTTIAKKLAERLDIMYLNTGAMYRALAFSCLEMGLNPKNEKDAINALNSTDLQTKYIDGSQHQIVNGKDITEFLKSPEISIGASEISKHKAVREKIVDMQREIAKSQSIVMDGRDIGSVVLPMANYKFFLDASVEERAKRRFEELSARDEKVDYNEILEDIKKRDYNDTHREISPLKATEGTIIIDSTNLSIKEVLDKFVSIIK